MAKLFVFGIGGTGSRVLRSLTMLLASGVKFGADEVIPVIIDPDTANADLTRSVSLLNKYVSVHNALHFSADDENRFFRTKMTRTLPNYTLHIHDTDDKRFQEFIEFSSMSRSNQALVKMLFSDKNLESSMEVGFKGNPNIGSVVLNQIAHSDDFQAFANSFSQGDRIFIISSIFGGTGASGFPLLLKTLRQGEHFANHELINNATIGAISILPYFRLEKDETSEIDSSTFISKTKSALAYYENNICKNGSIDALYYLADEFAATYKNHEGGSMQRNDAHLIEFLAATAIVDFSNSIFDSPTNFELGIKDVEGSVSFDAFYCKMHGMLYQPMTQFTMMTNALLDEFDRLSSSQLNANKSNFNDFYSSTFFGNLRDFLKSYREWLEEMKHNHRSLNLFNSACGSKPFELVVGVKPKKIMSLSVAGKSDYDLVMVRLNGAIKDCRNKETNNKFLEMYYRATQRLVNEKLNQ